MPAKPKTASRKPARPATTPREALLSSAQKLFYRNGIRASGIDTILADSGTAKMTLYNQFGSKEGLVREYLVLCDSEYVPSLRALLEKSALPARERPAEVFRLLHKWMESDAFRGCPMVNAAIEYPDDDHPIRAFIAERKRALAEFFAELVREAGGASPDAVGVQLAMLYHGTITWGILVCDTAPCAVGRDAAQALVDAAIAKAKTKR